MTETMTASNQHNPSVPPTTKVSCTVLRTYRRGGDGMPEADIHVGVGAATRTVTVFPNFLNPEPNVPPAQPYEGGRHPDPTPETTYSHQPDLWRDAWAEHLEDVEWVLESPAPEPSPIPMRLPCPECGTLHVDEGELITKVHHTHACQECGHVWRPAVVPTVGVQFLPGFKNNDG